MSDTEKNARDHDVVIDTRPLWTTPTVIVADVDASTRTAGFDTFDAPTSFGS